MTIDTLLLLILGVIIGFIVSSLFILRLRFGHVRIDRTNPEKDCYRIDLDDLDKLPKRKYILLKVDPNAKLSQK